MRTINCDDPTGLGGVQKTVLKLEREGKITKKQGIIIILDATVKMLEALKVPEDQSWEREEHGSNFLQNN
jgi:hypothetical protein